MSPVIEVTVREDGSQPGYWTVTSTEDEHEVHGRIVRRGDGTYAWEIHRPPVVPAGVYGQTSRTGTVKSYEEALEKIHHEWPGGPGSSWPTDINDA